MIRSFIALELDQRVHREIERLQAELRKARADVKWVRPEGVHLTLKFLGDVAETTIADMVPALAETIQVHAALSLRLQGLGTFPGPGNPRVVWLGLAGDLKPLANLQKDVETIAALYDFPPENRPFKPHLTLGRVRSAQGRRELLDTMSRQTPEPIAFQVTRVIYFKSDLKPSGAQYTALHHLPLKSPYMAEDHS